MRDARCLAPLCKGSCRRRRLRDCIFSPQGETVVALPRDQKRGKSHQRKASRPPLQTTSHPVELAAGSNARQVCAIDSKSKIFCLSLSRIISHTARANKIRRKKRADSTGWVVPRRSQSYTPVLAKTPPVRAWLDGHRVGAAKAKI